MNNMRTLLTNESNFEVGFVLINLLRLLVAGVAYYLYLSHKQRKLCSFE
jgi:hypothetical protein